MQKKTLLSASLVAVFSVGAYWVYVDSLLSQNSGQWIFVAAFIYFFPLIVESCDELQYTRVRNKLFLIIYLIGILGGLAYLVALWYLLNKLGQNFFVSVNTFIKYFMVLAPILLLPQKVFPCFCIMMQLYNRNKGVKS